jgi:formamidopyrimidine-DNA glycosylase
MPELPEVEAIARLLRPRICGQQIHRLRVVHRIVTQPQPPGSFEQKVLDKRITAVERRGKYLLLQLAPQGAGWVVLHFRLSGSVFWFPDHCLRGHVDVAFELDHGTLAYADPRHLGRVHWLKRLEDSAGIRELGVEPFSREFTAARLSQILQQSRRPVKQLLMDQARIAGVGNIYAAEALWRAKLNPFRPAQSLTTAEAHRLHKAIVGVLQRGIECCLDPAPKLHDPEWQMPGIERMLAVYQREGERCPRCRAPVRRRKQGNRSTFYCPRCQR